MNVDFSTADRSSASVWYDAASGCLYLQSGNRRNGIKISEIPDRDFESKMPIAHFSLGQNGSVVICHHKDGAETWLPVDMWLPDGLKVKTRTSVM
jgi:hypothetical protein